MISAKSLLYVFIVVIFSPQLQAVDKYVFAVKGGISLGSYEAGLNWAYIEQLRQLQKKGIARLDTFVGASAGSVNSLLSAIRYCQNESVSSESGRELFQRTWDVGIQDFIDLGLSSPKLNLFLGLKSESRTVEKKEGLFSRKGLERSLRYIEKFIKNGVNTFREGCRVKIGFAVTKMIPDVSIIAGIEVLNQRYIIPLEMIVSNKKLLFKNLNPREPEFVRQDNYLFLPESKGEVGLQDVFNAILASSAFPVIFSPIALNYCKAETNEVESSQSAHCPAGYNAHRNLFIDGGNFDNAPIGAAMKINDITNQVDDSVMILINPQNNRNSPTVTSTGLQSSSQTIPGIRDYLNLAYHIFDYGMSTELYQSARLIEKLQRESKNDRSSIIITDRYYPVVGDYLMHFGAFFDKAFREFDFYIGVYDGVINIAESQCDHNNSRQSSLENRTCVAEKTKIIVAQLGLFDRRSIELFKMLVMQEFKHNNDLPEWKWLDKKLTFNSGKNRLITIFNSIIDNKNKTSVSNRIIKNSFNVFLASIKKQDVSLTGFEEMTKRMINEKIDWKYALLNKTINRLYEIEKEKTEMAKTNEDEYKAQTDVFDLLKMSTYVGKTYYSKRSTGLWPNSTLGGSASLFTAFVPDEVGISYRQTSVYLKYKHEVRLAKEFFPIGIETRFIPIDWASRTRNVNKMLGVEFVLKWHTANPLLSSMGVGYGFYNVDFYGHSPDGKLNSFTTPLHGLIVDLGVIAGKIKISFVYRGEKLNSDRRGYVNWAVNLGLSDIKGLSWLW